MGRLVVSERAARRSAMIQPDVPEKRLPVTRREDLGSRLRKRSVDPFLVHREQSLALAACVSSAFCSRLAGRISTAGNHWKPGAEEEYPGVGNRKSPNRGKVIGLHLPGDVMDIHLSVPPARPGCSQPLRKSRGAVDRGPIDARRTNRRGRPTEPVRRGSPRPNRRRAQGQPTRPDPAPALWPGRCTRTPDRGRAPLRHSLNEAQRCRNI